MELTRMRSSVRRVTRLQTDKSGVVVASTALYEKERKNKKQSSGTKELGKGVRRVHTAVRTFEDEYIDRHNRSNQKKKDGWGKDMPTNVVKAVRKGAKKVKISKFM
jgi:hypothetical protein